MTARTPEVETAVTELQQQLAIMPPDELHEFFLSYMRRVYEETSDPIKQNKRRQVLAKFLLERTAALDAAMAKCIEARGASPLPPGKA